MRQLAAHPTYSCDPALEAKGVGCKIIPMSTWLAVPTPQDLARAYPPGAAQAGQTARVQVACKVTVEGLLKDCTVASVSVQVPAGEGAGPATQDAFGEAALKVTRYYQVRIPDLPPALRHEGHARFFIAFGQVSEPRGDDPAIGAGARGGIGDGVRGGVKPNAAALRTPASFAEPTAPPAFHSIWLKKPALEDLVRVYPADAIARKLTGEVVMACKVGADGRLNACDIARVSVNGAHAPDNPADDPGFGAATLELSKLFQMEPVSPSGQPTAGTTIRIPVRFQAAPAARARREAPR